MRTRIVNLVISFLFFMTLDFARAQSVYFPSLNKEKPCPSKRPKCVAVTSCKNALRSIKKKKNPVICGWDSDVPLVCCSRNNKVVLLKKQKKISSLRPKVDFARAQEKPCPSKSPKCVAVTSCKTALRSIKMKKNPVICGWDSDVPLVCCSRDNKVVLPKKQKKISSLSPKGCGRRHTSASLFADEAVYPPMPHDFRPQFIVGGETVKEPWPWMVSIFRGSSRRQVCGGTLIDDRHIITAAHCFEGRSVDVNLYKVQVGEINLNRNNREYSLQEIKKYENYRDRYYYHDIAIMRLSRPIADVTPACLPAEDDVRQGDNVTVLGWGDLFYGGPSASKLQELRNIPIVQQEKCDAVYGLKSRRFPGKNTSTLLCAGLEEGGKDACEGDSGGPMLQQYPDGRWTLVGVVSSGYKCAEPGYPGIYTKVSAYMKWIENYIGSKK